MVVLVENEELGMVSLLLTVLVTGVTSAPLKTNYAEAYKESVAEHKPLMIVVGGLGSGGGVELVEVELGRHRRPSVVVRLLQQRLLRPPCPAWAHA